MPTTLASSPPADACQSLLVHYGELALKGGNRRRFETQLIRNLSAALDATSPFDIRRLPGRISIDYPVSPIPKTALASALRVFGVANVAPTQVVRPNIEEITQAVAQLIAGRHFQTFAIRARRGEKTFPLTSMEVNCLLGAFVEKASGARVDLGNPELAIDIEILSQRVFVSCERFRGPGGLPVGSSGLVACLISGGIDSPVAAWRMMKRGCRPLFIHFHSAPYTSTSSVEKVMDLVEHLVCGQNGIELVIVPFGEIQQKIVAATAEEYRVILYRRFMMRIAEAIAREKGAEALATGESLAQVASQTLGNLATIEAVATLPILRPLVGMDKQEIVDEAKRIGTFEMSCAPHDDCCSFLLPQHPATHSTPAALERVERVFDVAGLVQLALAAQTTRVVA